MLPTLLTECIVSLDKIEDAKARAAVKAQIEADKKARAEKAAREKALREGRPITDNMASEPASAQQPAAAAAAPSGVAGKDYKETRLQIRLQGNVSGGPYTASLDSEKSKFATGFISPLWTNAIFSTPGCNGVAWRSECRNSCGCQCYHRRPAFSKVSDRLFHLGSSLIQGLQENILIFGVVIISAGSRSDTFSGESCAY
jgi:hypothetical protein